jgi:hypothetical protein
MSKRNGKTPPKGAAKADHHQGAGSGNDPEAIKSGAPLSQKSAPGAAPRDANRKASSQSNAKPNANSAKQERKHQ